MCAKVTKGNQFTWLLSIAHTWIDAHFTSSQSSVEISSYHCKNSLKVLQKLEKKIRKHPTVDENQHHKSEVLISISSVQFSCSVVYDSLQPHESLHARTPCPSPTPGVYSNSCPSSQRRHPAISSSAIPFSSCPQSLQHQGLFQWVKSSHEVAKVLKFQLQHQPLQWKTRTDLH